MTNLFRSEEALNEWLTRYPELKDKPRGTIEQALEEIKKRRKSSFDYHSHSQRATLALRQAGVDDNLGR